MGKQLKHRRMEAIRVTEDSPRFLGHFLFTWRIIQVERDETRENPRPFKLVRGIVMLLQLDSNQQPFD